MFFKDPSEVPQSFQKLTDQLSELQQTIYQQLLLPISKEEARQLPVEAVREYEGRSFLLISKMQNILLFLGPQCSSVLSQKIAKIKKDFNVLYGPINNIYNLMSLFLDRELLKKTNLNNGILQIDSKELNDVISSGVLVSSDSDVSLTRNEIDSALEKYEDEILPSLDSMTVDFELLFENLQFDIGLFNKAADNLKNEINAAYAIISGPQDNEEKSYKKELKPSQIQEENESSVSFSPNKNLWLRKFITHFSRAIYTNTIIDQELISSLSILAQPDASNEGKKKVLAAGLERFVQIVLENDKAYPDLLVRVTNAVSYFGGNAQNIQHGLLNNPVHDFDAISQSFLKKIERSIADSQNQPLQTIVEHKKGFTPRK